MALGDIRVWLPNFARQYLQVDLHIKSEADPSFSNIERNIGSITIIYYNKFICYIDPNKELELYKTSSFEHEHDFCQRYTQFMRKSCKVMTLPFDVNAPNKIASACSHTLRVLSGKATPLSI